MYVCDDLERVGEHPYAMVCIQSGLVCDSRWPKSLMWIYPVVTFTEIYRETQWEQEEFTPDAPNQSEGQSKEPQPGAWSACQPPPSLRYRLHPPAYHTEGILYSQPPMEIT